MVIDYIIDNFTDGEPIFLAGRSIVFGNTKILSGRYYSDSRQCLRGHDLICIFDNHYCKRAEKKSAFDRGQCVYLNVC